MLGNAVLEIAQAPLFLLKLEVHVLEVIKHVRLQNLAILDHRVQMKEIFSSGDVLDFLGGVLVEEEEELYEVFEFGACYLTICARSLRIASSSGTRSASLCLCGGGASSFSY